MPPRRPLGSHDEGFGRRDPVSAGGRSWTRETKAASRIASNMFWLSDEAEPSVPIPTVTPWRLYSRTAAMPDPSRRLAAPLCDTWAPLRLSKSISVSLIQMACAAENQGPTSPHASITSTVDLPNILKVDTP